MVRLVVAERVTPFRVRAERAVRRHVHHAPHTAGRRGRASTLSVPTWLTGVEVGHRRRVDDAGGVDRRRRCRSSPANSRSTSSRSLMSPTTTSTVESAPSVGEQSRLVVAVVDQEAERAGLRRLRRIEERRHEAGAEPTAGTGDHGRVRFRDHVDRHHFDRPDRRSAGRCGSRPPSPMPAGSRPGASGSSDASFTWTLRAPCTETEAVGGAAARVLAHRHGRAQVHRHHAGARRARRRSSSPRDRHGCGRPERRGTTG